MPGPCFFMGRQALLGSHSFKQSVFFSPSLNVYVCSLPSYSYFWTLMFYLAPAHTNPVHVIFGMTSDVCFTTYHQFGLDSCSLPTVCGDDGFPSMILTLHLPQNSECSRFKHTNGSPSGTSVCLSLPPDVTLIFITCALLSRSSTGAYSTPFRSVPKARRRAGHHSRP